MTEEPQNLRTINPVDFELNQGTERGLNWEVMSPNTVVLIDAVSILSDWSAGNRFKKIFRVTLGGNRTLANPTGAKDGQTAIYEVIQDGTGTRTLAYDTKFAFGTDIASITLTTTASKRDFIGVIYNAIADKFYIVAVAKGY